MSSFSLEAVGIIESLSQERQPFHSDTLKGYLNEGGANEVILCQGERLTIDSNAMIRIVFLIAERRRDAKSCLSVASSNV